MNVGQKHKTNKYQILISELKTYPSPSVEMSSSDIVKDLITISLFLSVISDDQSISNSVWLSSIIYWVPAIPAKS